MPPFNLLHIPKRFLITAAANACHNIGLMTSSVPVFTATRFSCLHFSTTGDTPTTPPSLASPNPTVDELAEFAKRIPIEKRSLSLEVCPDPVDDESLLARERIATIPNLICILRIASTPLLGFLVVNEQFLPACILFLFISFTDILDGFIARHFPSQRSLLGSFLDPVADKFLIGTLFITLTYMQLISVPVTVVVFGRDFLLVFCSFLLRYKMLESPVTARRFFDPTVSAMQVQPTSLSKHNTFIQLSLVFLSLAAPVFNLKGHFVLQLLQFLTVSTTILSGLQYALRSGVLRVKFKQK